jgi:hypothetical protein
MPLDRILLNTGPSPNGWHKAETFMLCPRRRGWDHLAERDPGRGWHFPATARGTLVHVGLAHYYARMKCEQEGTDPDAYYDPETAIALLPRVEENEHDACTMLVEVPTAIKALKGYIAHYAFEKVRVLAVEQVVEIPVPGTGGPGEPPMKTARVDLIYSKGSGDNERIFFVDHKSTGRITNQHAKFYARSGQFLLLRWLGKHLGDRFGGVVLNLVQCAIENKYTRPSLDPVPGFLVSLPLALGWFERQRIAFEESGLPPELWPPIPSEHTCQGRYSGCPYRDKCDVAVPESLDMEWPKVGVPRPL